MFQRSVFDDPETSTDTSEAHDSRAGCGIFPKMKLHPPELPVKCKGKSELLLINREMTMREDFVCVGGYVGS